MGKKKKKKSLLFVCWQFRLAGVSAIVGKVATAAAAAAVSSSTGEYYPDLGLFCGRWG